VKVAVRDDDTCYFTSPADLERVYRDVWDRVPICLATVPFAVGYPRAGIPESEWHSGRKCPLDQNPELVSWLRRKIAERRVTIALHGYTHEDYANGFEFQAAPDPERRVSEGRAYLERVLGVPIRVFVPPHNALSKRGLDAVSRAGLNVLGSFLSFRPSNRSWDRHTLSNWWRIQQFRRATDRTRASRLVYPHPLRYARHAEFGCHGLIPSTTYEELVAGFDEARRFGGDFCLATHYWEVDGTLQRVLIRFLEYAASHGDVRFVTAEELFDSDSGAHDRSAEGAVA
jgi:predicted deacetylase